MSGGGAEPAGGRPDVGRPRPGEGGRRARAGALGPGGRRIPETGGGPEAGRDGQPVPSRAGFLERVTRLELEPSEVSMIRILERTRDRDAMRCWYTAELHLDPIARDFAADIQDSRAGDRPRLARMLLEVSPGSPYALATLIEHDERATAAQVAEWAGKVPDSPLVLGALARLHTRQNQPREAERDLIHYLEIQPDPWASKMLADNYKARGDMRRWRDTLERALDVEETGLEHAQLRVELADYLMDQGQWAEAKEYAEAAGETWAAWAMMCAQRCAEGMKDWPRAELWARRQSERYPDQVDTRFRWFLFCTKTGRGDLPAARRFTEGSLRDVGGIKGLHPDVRGHYRWLNGDLKAAAAAFRESYERSPGFGSCLLSIAVSDLLGDRATADAYRERLGPHRQQAPAIIHVVELLPGTLKGGRSSPPDLTAVSRALGEMRPRARPAAEIWVGLFLKAHGRPAEARPFLEHCVASRVIPEWHRAVAGQALRDTRR